MTAEGLMKALRVRAWVQIVTGVLVAAAGAVATYMSWLAPGTSYYVFTGAIAVGVVAIANGVWRLMAAYERADNIKSATLAPGDLPAVSATSTLGYKSFVAWRYLLERRRRIKAWVWIALVATLAARAALWLIVGNGVGDESISTWHGIVAIVLWIAIGGTIFWGVLRKSKPASFVFLIGIVVGVGCTIAGSVIRYRTHGPFDLEDVRPILQTLGISALAGFGLAGLAMFFGCVRGVFTFFTTVPIGGVWIGTAALICVLSVMSGFESDLRQKILGSNAHLQITKEDGDFVGWEATKARIDKIPGVVASTPYAVSEVVVAANNNGVNVIIKGIDPATVGKVTDLVNDIDEETPAARAAAMKKLEPLIDDPRDRAIPQTPKPAKDTVDPPPDDMPSPGDPIDFSGSGSGSGAGSGEYGGDAVKILDIHPVDPPPPDLLTNDDKPMDYSGSGSVYRVDKLDDTESAIRVVDAFDGPIMSRRTMSLPGILVGKELVKQTHVMVGDEVRVVSPLSDPANPDATGTPIPFNRDYRVAGRFYTGMYEYDLKYVYVTLDSLSEFLDLGDAIDGIEVRIEDPDDTDRFVTLINSAIGPGYRVVDWKELNRSLFSALKLEKIAMFLVLGIVILVASFSIVGNLIMVVIEKAREIALLKTLGASDWGVMNLFAIQGLMIGLIGTLLGVLTGLAGCWAGKAFGLPLNPDVYYIDRLPIHVEGSSVLAASAAGILISIAATLYPAMLAARVRPAAGMRH